MKLTFNQPPEGYDADKAATLTDDNGEFVLIGCPNAAAVAMEIAHRVNMYDFMVAALTPLKSSEMGTMIVNVVTDNPPPMVGPEEIAKVKERMTKLINAIDVILKGVELHKERMDETFHRPQD